MSWIEDNYDDLEGMRLQSISNIEEKLTDENITKLYTRLSEDYVFLVVDILKQFNVGHRLSYKQKNCIAKYIFENDLEYILDKE